MMLSMGAILILFLSTLSLRRATSQHPRGTTSTTYFYPRSPCGERHLRVVDGSKSSIISIHALLAESDTGKSTTLTRIAYISIHALLAESDNEYCSVAWLDYSISIHALLAESDDKY